MIDNDDTGEEYLPLEEAQRRLRLSRRQVYRLASDGRIRTVPTRRGQVYHAGDVDRLAREGGAERRPPVEPDEERSLARSQAAELAPIRAEVSALRQRADELPHELAQTVRDEIARIARDVAQVTRDEIDRSIRPDVSSLRDVAQATRDEIAPIASDVGALRQLTAETREELAKLRQETNPDRRDEAERQVKQRLATLEDATRAVEAAQLAAAARARTLTIAIGFLAVAIVVAALLLVFLR